MQYLYLACLIFAIGMMLWLKIFDLRKSVTQFTTLLIITVANLGFYYLSVAPDLDEAIFAQQIAWAGGVFLPVFYFFLVLEMCHVEISRFVSIALVLIQSILYSIVCTVGRNKLFYENVSIHSSNGVVILDAVKGPLHIIYPIMMFLYLYATIAVVIHAIRKNKSVDIRGGLAMIFFIAIAVGVYLFEAASDFEYEIIPVAYDLLMMGALIPIYDSNLFTVHENKEIVGEQLSEVGFLTFDVCKAYKGCNEFMLKLFPELSNYRLGLKIEKCSEELQRLINCISEVDNNKNVDVFMLGDRYYAGMVHIVKNPVGKVRGYTIEIKDETEHYSALAMKEHFNEELSREVEAKTAKIGAIQQQVLLGMAQMVESRDLSTGGHIKRTSDVVKIFADKLLELNFGLDKEYLRLVVCSAPMHDLGKIGVDDAILRKQARFTDEEYSMMKKHAEIGYHMINEILSSVEEPAFVKVAENIAHFHHEKVDGTGYPMGLKGDEIPIEARIMALADVFDALVSKRCYKDAYSYDTAFGIIEKDAGTHFDERLAKVFMQCRPELEKYYNAATTC